MIFSGREYNHREEDNSENCAALASSSTIYLDRLSVPYSDMRNPTINGDVRVDTTALNPHNHNNGRMQQGRGGKSSQPPSSHTPSSTEDRNANVKSSQSRSAETKLADYVVQCLNDYGICVVDNFLGNERGLEIFQEVVSLYQQGDIFKDGELIKQD